MPVSGTLPWDCYTDLAISHPVARFLYVYLAILYPLLTFISIMHTHIDIKSFIRVIYLSVNYLTTLSVTQTK
jgi:hypothetical protein